MPVDVKYTTSATATGGRDGRSQTKDGALDVKLARPKELGAAADPATIRNSCSPPDTRPAPRGDEARRRSGRSEDPR